MLRVFSLQGAASCLSHELSPATNGVSLDLRFLSLLNSASKNVKCDNAGPIVYIFLFFVSESASIG